MSALKGRSASRSWAISRGWTLRVRGSLCKSSNGKPGRYMTGLTTPRCSEAEALPRYIKEGNQLLIIMRLANYHTSEDIHSVQLNTWSVSELTNRYTIVIDYDRKLIGTLHVHSIDFTDRLKVKYARKDLTLHQFKWIVMHNVIRDNAGSITANQKLFDECERTLVTATQKDDRMEGMGVSKQIYSIMRHCSVSRMMLTETYNLLRDMKMDHPITGAHHSSLLRLEERLRQSLFYVEETHTSSKDLLSLHFGTASHRTNELVRLLTLLNAIFIPLSFIAGFYGMNFEYMPGVSQPIPGIDGVWCVIFLMLCVSSGLLLWFYTRGWL
eukprot:TRINITY_DN101_c0_g3_i1.p1 TRINITY_DN101_c0_g3~~TRINITY_DN101_c0_g3_i1.p1  ORF type:complete len:326 (+),score=37.34 TRINITY_DN101_c0_g3_i1:143-1120(+)